MEKDIELESQGAARGATEPIDDGPKGYDITAEEDPMKWALEFKRVRKAVLERTGEDIADDPGAMVGWFANAFQRGEWNSPHYKEWLENHLRTLTPQDSDPLDMVGTNEHDIGLPHTGGSKSTPVKNMFEYRSMIQKKRAAQVPMAWLQYDDQGNQILVTNIDGNRLQHPSEKRKK